MASISEPIQFEAKWNNTNEDLKPFCHETWKKIAFNILSIAIPIIGLARLIYYAVQFICRKIILHSSNFSHSRKEEAREDFASFWSHSRGVCQRNFRPIALKLKTADGAEISATYFKHRNSNQNTPLVLYCCPNAMLDKEMPYIHFIEAAARRSEADPNLACDFITFDYRGTGDSEKGNAWRADDLVLDADAAVQFAKNQLEKPNHKIHIVTYSLGGGVGAKLKALHPELTGSITNISSYSSLEDAANYHTKLGCVVKNASWDLPTIDYWSKLNGRKLAVFHPKDSVLPPKCSLYPQLEKKNQTAGTESIQLHHPICDDLIDSPQHIFHCLKLKECTNSQSNQNALDQVMDFILRDEYANASLLQQQQGIPV